MMGKLRFEKFPGLGVHRGRAAMHGHGLVAGVGGRPNASPLAVRDSERSLYGVGDRRSLARHEGPFVGIGDPSLRQLLLPICDESFTLSCSTVYGRIT